MRPTVNFKKPNVQKMKLLRKIAVILVSIFVIGCSQSMMGLNTWVNQFAEKNNLLRKTYTTENFNILTLQRISDPKKIIRIYIEGDGFAYVNKSRPSVDPTPRSHFLFGLITQDNSPNLIYIARPCQYVDSPNCEEKYWTHERFSQEVIDAVSEVINNFKDSEIEIIGYSGGGMFALQMPQKNIKNIRTIAGNINLEEFVELHRIDPLKTPKINYRRLSRVPQVHFIGADDKIITPRIFNRYHKQLPRQNCARKQIVYGATHAGGWQGVWGELLRFIPSCERGCLVSDFQE
jgi:hypothetical protein